ncbi:MAG TPA: OsmC family protein [Terriglobia bacterium]|nr:OsmC family protein [Terriglobia bacterium]
MEGNYVFRANARWTGARNGTVEAASQAPPVDFSAPPEFQGEAGKWTPEHFLLAAAAACFITTFRAIAELSKFSAEALEVAAEGRMGKAENGIRFTQIVLRPLLTIRNPADRERALRLLEKAERSCLVSRSLRSEVRMEPDVRSAAAEASAA